jgi:biotin synthase-related radical SAM superfamily protein
VVEDVMNNDCYKSLNYKTSRPTSRESGLQAG